MREQHMRFGMLKQGCASISELVDEADEVWTADELDVVRFAKIACRIACEAETVLEQANALQIDTLELLRDEHPSTK